MAEWSEFYAELDAAERLVQSGESGSTRATLNEATSLVRSALEGAAQQFLRGNNHPPPDIAQLANVIDLLKEEFEFEGDKRLARKFARAINGASKAGHSSTGLPPPLDAVRNWLEIARQFLDALQTVTGDGG